MADIINFPGAIDEHMMLTCPDCGDTKWMVDIHLMLFCVECGCSCHALASITEYLGIQYEELDFNEPA